MISFIFRQWSWIVNINSITTHRIVSFIKTFNDHLHGNISPLISCIACTKCNWIFPWCHWFPLSINSTNCSFNIRFPLFIGISRKRFIIFANVYKSFSRIMFGLQSSDLWILSVIWSILQGNIVSINHLDINTIIVIILNPLWQLNSRSFVLTTMFLYYLTSEITSTRSSYLSSKGNKRKGSIPTWFNWDGPCRC